MSGFDEWLDNKWQLLLGAGRDDWDDEDMKMAYNKGMERAAEIADEAHLECDKRHCTNQDAAELIRKEIT